MHVAVERRRQSRQAQVSQVALEQPRRLRVEDASVRRACRLAARIERKHERVDERYPAEARTFQARPHRDAVREHDVDSGLVQCPLREVWPTLSDRARHGARERLTVQAVARRARHPVQRLLRAMPDWIREHEPMRDAEGRNAIQRQSVELAVGGRTRAHGTHRVRVRVDGTDGPDVRAERGIDGHLGGEGRRRAQE